MAAEDQEPIDMSDLVSFTLQGCQCCTEIVDEFFQDGETWTKDFREQRGDTAIAVEPWKQSSSLGAQTRTVRLRKG